MSNCDVVCVRIKSCRMYGSYSSVVCEWDFGNFNMLVSDYIK